MPHTAEDILCALAAAGRPVDPGRARLLACDIGAYGDLEATALALAHDGAPGPLNDLLAYRAALAEAADPARRVARLHAEAEGLDARAEPAWAEAAQFHGRAAYRRLQQEHGLADQFAARAQACEALAAALEAEALSRRLEAASLKAGADARRAMAELIAELAA